MSDLAWIQNWYKSNCDGDWEHSFGISITTLDNPGWEVKIDLSGTPLQGTSFQEKRVTYDDDEDWHIVKIENNIFIGYGGPTRLSNIIEEFYLFHKSITEKKQTH